MIRVEYSGASGKGLIAAVVGALRRKRLRSQIDALLLALPSDTDNYREVLKVVSRWADVWAGDKPVPASPPPAPARRRDGLEASDLLF